MPYSHEIHPEERYALVIAEGACDLYQTFAALASLVGDPGFGPGFGVLVDARSIEYTPEPDDTRQIAGFATQRDVLLHQPLAIAVEQDVNYGMGRLYSAVASLQGATVEVFRDLEEARAWLLATLRSGRAWKRTGEET